jgi:hypothetical protein
MVGLIQTGDTFKTNNKRAIGKSIAGRNIHDGVDFYQTPSWATEKLLKKELFSGLVMEPCSGNGAISTVLENYGYTVKSSDLRTDDIVYGTKGLSIFDIPENSCANIITNPPYCIAKEVIEKSLEIATDKVAMLLKLTFLESTKRHLFFKSTPLKKIYVFSNRLTMYHGMEPPKNNGTIAYAWFIWERGYVGAPSIDWVI